MERRLKSLLEAWLTMRNEPNAQKGQQGRNEPRKRVGTRKGSGGLGSRTLAALIVGLFGWGPVVGAQSISDLSPAQQQMLQQLPESKKQELLQKYRQRQQTGQSSSDEQAQDQSVEKRRKEVAEAAQKQYGQASSIEKRLRTRLGAPSKKEGQVSPSLKQDLAQYGYELFQGPPTTFAPVTDIPVPTQYSVGPGDTIEVMLYGQKNAQYSLTVDRNGQINLPEIGPLNVAGQDFESVAS